MLLPRIAYNYQIFVSLHSWKSINVMLCNKSNYHMYLDVIITVCQIPNIQLVCKKRWKGSNSDKTHPGRINKFDCYFFEKHLGPKKALIYLQLFVSLFFWTMCCLEFESISKHIYCLYDFRYTIPYQYQCHAEFIENICNV